MKIIKEKWCNFTNGFREEISVFSRNKNVLKYVENTQMFEYEYCLERSVWNALIMIHVSPKFVRTNGYY